MRFSSASLLLLLAAFSGQNKVVQAAVKKSKKINWSPCNQDISADLAELGVFVSYECALVNVPLDCSAANSPAVQLSLVRRLPATGAPEDNIGSIMLNPGGPGGSGVNFALFFGPDASGIWGAEVTERFDILGFDPRGIARSKGFKCFGNTNQPTAIYPDFLFPLTAEEELEQ